MKKILFLVGILLLSSCACILSQIPPQTLYANNNCEAALPDYTKKVIVSDNCPTGTIISQTPIVGTMLNVGMSSITVEIQATDMFGNKSNKLFVPVILIDTIKPILSWPLGQINMGDKGVLDLYRNWEAAVKVNGIANFIYDQSWTQGTAFADTLYVDECGIAHLANIPEGLKLFTHTIMLTDEEYSQFLAIKNNNKKLP